RMVRIDQARIVEGAPGNHPADAGFRCRSAVRLRMSDGLHLLKSYIASPPVLDVETLARGVVELPDSLSQHERHSRNRIVDADASVWFRMVVVECEDVLVPILLPRSARTRSHRTGGGARVVE